MTLVYGYDFSDASTLLAPAAAALAARLGQALLVVHVRDPVMRSLEPEAEARIDARVGDRVGTLAAELDRAWPGCRARALQLRGSPAAELAAVAAREAAELLVVASGPHSGPLLRVGTTSERVAVEAECPVLVLRAAEPIEAWARGARPLRIVLGVSDDASCAGAVQWTTRLRSAAPCDVTATQVYPVLEVHDRYGLPLRMPWTVPDPEVEALVAREIRRRLGALGGQGGLVVHPKLGLGRVADHLLDVAERSAADLVVLGTHRARGLARLASASEGVLHHGRTSVLLVPDGRARTPSEIPELRRILVATDLSPASATAVRHGLSLAAAAGGELHLLHVVEQDDPLVAEAVTLAADLRSLVPQTLAVPVRTEVVGARDVSGAIVAAAERLEADVVCIASHGRSGLKRLTLGSVAERVVRSCRRPVLVVRAEQD